MAKKKKQHAPSEPTERRSPLVLNALLWVGFLVVLAIGVVTVFVPELADDGDEEAAGEVSDAEADDSAEAADEPAPSP